MLAAGVVDSACVGWQLDQWMQDSPGNKTISLIALIADALPSTVPVYTHWVNEALAWWKTGGEVWTDKYQTINVVDRFTWWQAMAPYLTGGYHQGDTAMAVNDPKLYQDKLKDTLDPFNDGKGRMGLSLRSGTPVPFRLVGFEGTGQGQFDGWISEETGDSRGYLITCTTGAGGTGLSGYGNGARRPDGSAL